ncbi:Heterokaryon incompatibility protein 6 OR allele [Lachnellula suecica]|uniref:Heterokaryon incompatibility protein 6 OR allele n=1 Tax=Lachnellula suecica TaxID=602035 RepID=A0A8T9C8T0_9HELO|nr:Heterokaryon incompatibility protein 6 OR allele [Lachnellula suecica]
MAGSEFDNEPLYEPLDTIRLLRLPWGKDATKFDGYLESFALNSPNCPDFVALSYTWGHSIHPKPINLNGHKYDVLACLYPFLKLAPNLPEFSSDTWWWIDSICINQKDENEKSSQMVIMGKIYQRACRTVVWLGEEVDANCGEESRDCTHSIKSLYRLCDEMDKVTFKGGSFDREKLQKLREPESGMDWKSVERLLVRPWWRRVWTLQEFLISDHLRFYCGRKSISRKNLHDAIYSAWACRAWDDMLMSKKAFYAGWNRRRMNQWYEKRNHEIGLIAMMAYVGDCGATDERDRVYSLLGVAKDSNLVGQLDPASSVEYVYTALVKSFIAKYNVLDIICYAHVFSYHARGSNAKISLPSWIPDWRAPVEGKVIPVMASQGSISGTGNFRPAWVHRRPVFEISKDSKLLTCNGVIIDTIDGLVRSNHTDAGKITDQKAELPLEQSTSEHNLRLDWTSNFTSELMETISRCLALDRADRYLGEYITPGFFRDDFKKACKAYFDDPSRRNIPIWFGGWLKRSKSLRIRGRTLEEHCRQGSSNASVPRKSDYDGGTLKQFYGRVEDTVVEMARRLTITEKGYLGMAACRARKGDSVCVLYGCNIPVLLRKKAAAFEFIGECYLEGFMNGKALDKDTDLTEVQFRIA